MLTPQLFLAGGCLAYKVVSVPVKLAATTAVVAGETAGSVVTTTGKLAASAAKTAGSVGSSGLEAAAKLAQSGMVTIVDSKSGGVVRVPSSEAMNLGGAGVAARIDTVQLAVEIIRAGRVVYRALQKADPATPVVAGDVVVVGK